MKSIYCIVYIYLQYFFTVYIFFIFYAKNPIVISVISEVTNRAKVAYNFRPYLSILIGEIVGVLRNCLLQMK